MISILLRLHVYFNKNTNNTSIKSIEQNIESFMIQDLKYSKDVVI